MWFTSLPVPVQTALVSATVSSLVAVAGWVISYRFAVRAQRLNLQNQTINSSREVVVKALRDYQDWLSDMIGWTASLYAAQADEDTRFPKDWRQISMESATRVYDSGRSVAWNLVLEDHQVVFPETRNVRHYLNDHHRELVLPKIHELFGAIRSRDARERLFRVEQFAVFQDQSALITALTVHIQNQSFGRLLDRHEPVPEPIVTGLPRLVMVDGMLEVVPSDEASASRGRQIQGPIPAHLDPAVRKTE
jgi:hypothetical protein